MSDIAMFWATHLDLLTSERIPIKGQAFICVTNIRKEKNNFISSKISCIILQILHAL